ncbi:MAG TPA: efflux RND transporter periplasmic adaptor subunit [Polyangiaceae bacterium]|nr:efflux RND transporter periplasmic adaptor subunit [Polyangiaceae bacterium]
MISKGLLATGALLGALAGGSWLWSAHRSTAGAVGPGAAAAPAPSASAPIAVEVWRVAAEPLEVQVTATGTLLGREAVELVSELSRRLARVRAEEGARVRQGEILFELDASDLHAELAKLEVQARLARATLERTERLSAEGLSNQQELDLAHARVDEAHAERRALRVTLDKTLIRAPFAGTLGLRRVSEGAWVSPSTVLSTLQDTASLKLDFTLPERYAGAVRQGGEFRFRVEGRAETFTGRVAAIEPSVDAATRSLLVRGVMGGDTGLVPGSAASVEVPLRVERALLVPSLAIVPGIEGRRVFVAANGRARSTPVEVGYRSGDRAQIVSGLHEGDAVITTNLLRLREDMPITVASAEAVR